MIVRCFLIGVVAGLRALTAPAALSRAAARGAAPLDGTWAAFLGGRVAPPVLAALALGEFATDKAPGLPSRKTAPQFAARIASGGFCGAALGAAAGATGLGLAAGAAGAVVGTLGGAAARARLAEAFGRDAPAGLLEDAAAVAGAAAVVGGAAGGGLSERAERR